MEDLDISTSDEYALVNKIAARLYARRFDDSVSFEDYRQYGFLGYLEAKKKYNPSHNVSFEAYAAYRIKGAILNNIFKSTEKLNFYYYKKRQDRYRKRELASLRDSLLSKNFGMFSDAVVNIAFGFILDEFFEEGVFFEDDNRFITNDAVGIGAVLLDALKHLDRKEADVIQLHYYSDFAFSDIAEIMELSKGRISQLHLAAINKIKSKVLENEALNLYY